MSDPRVLIIGAGFGGIAAAIELQSHGFDEITILERAPGLGGTWFHNSYPGAACDVPSHLYSYSFAQRRDWSRLCSPQREILDYLSGVAHAHGLDRRLETNAEVSACRWDDSEQIWTVSTTDGRSWQAGAVIIATGQLHRAARPPIEGAE
ncbi:MAG: FAD-dependent oxidoreductase, partial [Solirubrobacterales bacterium]